MTTAEKQGKEKIYLNV